MTRFLLGQVQSQGCAPSGEQGASRPVQGKEASRPSGSLAGLRSGAVGLRSRILPLRVRGAPSPCPPHPLHRPFTAEPLTASRPAETLPVVVAVFYPIQSRLPTIISLLINSESPDQKPNKGVKSHPIHPHTPSASRVLTPGAGILGPS